MNLKKNEEFRLIDRSLVNTFIRKREREIHKGNCGRVLIIAGSKGMTGAAVLSARAALRAGAGLVRVSVPEELFPIVQVGAPEATCVSRDLPEEFLAEHQAIVIGPGLGEMVEHVELIQKVLSDYTGPVVLDADGLNLLAGHPQLALKADKGCNPPRLILTPHPGEAARLLSCKTEDINGDREAAARTLAWQYEAVTVLKGAGSLVAMPSGTAYINKNGNPGMATGGSGDVLSGVIGALAGQGIPTWAAACCGVYLHGLAGDLAAKAVGEYGLIASDLAYYTALAIKKLLEE